MINLVTLRMMLENGSLNTRSRVLEAARNLLMEKGIAAVSLKDIRELSGVSNGSIFHHFGSKDGVVVQIFMAERTRYLTHVAEAIMRHEGDPCDAFGEGARAAIEYQMRDPQRFLHLILNFNDSEWLDSNKSVWIDIADELEKPVIEWATPYLQSGELPNMPAPFFQALMLGSTERMLYHYLTGRLDRDPRDMADHMAEVVSSGLKQLRSAG